MQLNKSPGFTLIELMIASILSLLLVAAVIKIYLMVKTNFQVQQQMAQMQDNARVAMVILQHEIRMAGYMGCPRFSDDFYQHNFTNTSHYAVMPTKNIIITTKNSDTDELSVQQSDIPGGQLVEDMTNNTKLFVKGGNAFKRKEVIIVSDCDYISVATISSIENSHQGQVLHFAKSLQHKFKIFSATSPLTIKRYFIKSNGKSTQHTALYVANLSEEKQEVVPNISKMKFTYMPPSVKKNHNVAAVKIELLVESESELTTNPVDFLFHGKHYKSTDRKLRRQWTSVVALRSSMAS